MKADLKLAVELELERETEIPRGSAPWLEGFHLRRGSLLSLQDRDGKWFRARVRELSASELRVKVFEELEPPVESDLFLTLLQAVPNKERMETIIEKAVELGVDLIQPFFSARSYRLHELPQSKWRRWQDRARRAAEQCRRGIVPKVAEPRPLLEAVKVCGDAELKLVLYEGEGERELREFLAGRGRIGSCALAVGPEGGFEELEIEALRQEGFKPVSLGGRILRVETAAIVGMGIVQYSLGDLAGRRPAPQS